MQIQFKNKILIPILNDYYLFDYFKILIPKLVNAGLEIDIITLDPKVVKSYSKIIKKKNIKRGPFFIKFLNNRSGNLFYRFLLWILARGWVSKLKKKYKFAIVPWDYRIIWYLIAIKIPSLTINNTYNFTDIRLELENDILKNKDLKVFPNTFFLYLEKIFDINILPKAGNYYLNYNKMWIFDKLMGSKRINNLHAFSGIKYFTVMGKKTEYNYKKLGVGTKINKTEIITIGNPAYENLLNLKDTFTNEKKLLFLKNLGIQFKRRVFTFFLSLSSFTNLQIEELDQIFKCIVKEVKGVWLVVKLHPKTGIIGINKIKFLLENLKANFTIINEFHGEIWNAKLVLSSECLIQKQSTTGYLAFIYKIPVLSYNIYHTNYYDNLYGILGGSIHSQNIEEFKKNLKLLSNTKILKKLKQDQEIACKNFCDIEKLPSKEIIKIIKKEISLGYEK